MTSRIRIAASASSLVLAFASAAHAAQPAEAVPTAGPEAAAPEAQTAELGEIVVTARRKSESLQQVPQSVSAVTAETLGKLNIQRLEDVTAVTPGFSLTSGTSGYSVARLDPRRQLPVGIRSRPDRRLLPERRAGRDQRAVPVAV